MTFTISSGTRAAVAGAAALAVLTATAPAAYAAIGDGAASDDGVTGVSSDACRHGGRTRVIETPGGGTVPTTWRVIGYTVTPGCAFTYSVEWLTPNGQWAWSFGEVKDHVDFKSGVDVEGTPCRVILSLERLDGTKVDVVDYFPGAPASCYGPYQTLFEWPEYVL